jgi:hypothetical protein
MRKGVQSALTSSWEITENHLDVFPMHRGFLNKKIYSTYVSRNVGTIKMTTRG